MAPPTREATVLVSDDQQRFRETLQLLLPKTFHQLGRQIGLTLSLVVTTIIIVGLLFNLGYVWPNLALNSELTLTVTFTCLLLILVFFVLNRKREHSALKRRLVLWGEITTLPNPRFGFESTLSTALEKLRAFYEADDCLLIGFAASDSKYCIRRVAANGGVTPPHTENLTDECARRLLVAPETHAFVFKRGMSPFFGERYFGYDVIGKKGVTRTASGVDSLLAMLDAEAIISVPVFNHNTATGRLFLTSSRKRAFSVDDLDFLSELIGHILPLIESMRFVDMLASSARENERKRIALDIHDNVVQRYIGIELGLAAIRQKIHAGRIDIGDDLEKLSLMAQLEVGGLRRYMQQLSSTVQHDGPFLANVQRLTEEFTATTGIAVILKSGQDFPLNDRLATEAFQMISEGLSNIRRHTEASEATIEIDSCPKSFNLRIANNGRNGNGATRKFVPKSITSRAASLGGVVDIELFPHGKTVLSIGIPM